MEDFDKMERKLQWEEKNKEKKTTKKKKSKLEPYKRLKNKLPAKQIQHTIHEEFEEDFEYMYGDIIRKITSRDDWVD